MVPFAVLERQHADPVIKQPSLVMEKPLLRMSGSSVAFSETELEAYMALSERYYGVRPTTQETLERCTMLVSFLRVVWTGKTPLRTSNAAAVKGRSGTQESV